jgi:thiol reductant ABC exporter CydC subunit
VNVSTRLLTLIAPYWKWIAVAVLLSFLTISSSVALIATASYLISRAALVTEVAQVTIAITSVRLFATLRAGFRYLERFISHRATFHLLAHIRAWFYEAIEPLAPARLTDYRSGDLLTRSMEDIETLENFYVRVVVPPVAAGLVAVFVCALLGAFAWALAVALLFFLVLTGVVLPLVMRALGGRPAAELVDVRSDLNALLVDQIQGIADLLVVDQAAASHSRVLAVSRRLGRIQERLAALRGASNALSALFVSLAALTILVLAIPLVTRGEVDGVYLALLPLAAVASFEALQPLSLALQQLEASHASARRIFEMIDAPPAVRDPASPAPAPAHFDIEARDVTFRYAPLDPAVLAHVSFRVAAGERLGIVGPSGAGKSTIAHLLLRFWECQEGRITLGGRDLRDYRADDVRAVMGTMPQDVHLFHGSVRDNLYLADPDATDDQIARACRQALLDDVIRRLPDGYDSIIGEDGVLLSGGERQRLALARVILKDAPIVILDEPTANLDAPTEQRLMDSLEPFLSTRTVVIISHRPAALARVDHVLHLDLGRVQGPRRRSSSARPEKHVGIAPGSPA